MKNLLLIAFAFVSFQALAQVKIEKEIDDMTEEVSYYVSHLFVVANDDNTQGITIKAMLKEDKTAGKIYSDGWIVMSYNLGGCNENNELIFLFEDGSKFSIKSWSKFRCKNYSFFSLTLEEEAMISSKKISKVRFTNGYTFDSYTGAPVNGNFFIQVYDALEEINK